MAILVQSNKKPSVTFPSLTGDIVTFNSQYAGLPLKSCVSQISGYQEGSGTPSPSNERPLHAFSSASLSATGKNLFRLDIDYIKSINTRGTWNGNDYTDMNIVFSCTVDGRGKIIVITANGTANGRADLNLNAKLSNNILQEGIAYTVNGSKSGSISSYGIFIGDNITNTYRATDGDLSFTPNQQFINNNYYMRISVISGTVMNNVAFYPMLRVQGNNTFEPYNGNTTIFTFGQSIYQGSIDWKRGVVVGLWSGKVDMGLLNWGYNSNYQAFYISLPNMYIPTTVQERMQGIANEVYPISTVDAISSMDDKSCLRYNGYLWTKDSDYTDRDDFKNSLIGKYVAYELATPIEIQLSPVQLETLLAENNIWADTGETTASHIKIGG